jgi:hypothetical protein
LPTFVRFGIAKVETIFDLSTYFRKIFCFSVRFSNRPLSFKVALGFASQLVKAGFWLPLFVLGVQR